MLHGFVLFGLVGRDATSRWAWIVGCYEVMLSVFEQVSWSCKLWYWIEGVQLWIFWLGCENAKSLVDKVVQLDSEGTQGEAGI